MKCPEVANPQRQKVREWLSPHGIGGGSGGEQGIVANGYEISFLGDGDVLELGCGDVCTTIVNILKTLNCML